jgi:hypothetical protein
MDQLSTRDRESDQELLPRFASGGVDAEDAFRVLVERHLDHIHSVALRVTRNAALAADISQLVRNHLGSELQ